MTPEKIGRYEIKSELGRGGMATVYGAYDPVFERTVAVKVLPREFMHDPEFRARFVREAKTIAALEHPAIVPVYDFGEDDGQPYLVLRLMPGGSLADKLKQGPLSIDETATILRRLGSALNHAHHQGIVHRDLKPGNILFDQYGGAFLTDFGIVHIASSSSALTASGSLVGTPTYMSPEQVYGDKALDGRSDIYALGVIVYQMLTGYLPYDADTPARVMMKHVMDPVPDILEVRPDLPPACSDIITKAMAKKPGERFATASDLSEALASLATRKTAQPEIANRLAEARPEPVTQPGSVADPATTPAAAEAPVGRARPAARRLTIPAWAWGALAALALICVGSIGVGRWLFGTGFGLLGSTATATIAPLSSPTTVVFVAAATAATEVADDSGVAAVTPLTTTPAGPTVTPNLAKTRESAAATRQALTATPTAASATLDLAATRDSAAATRAAALETPMVSPPGIAPAFGPQDGRLDHDPDDTIESVYSGVNLRNFVVEATLGNPYAATAGGWDFGLIFRQAEVDDELRLVVESNGDWSLNDRRGSEDNFVQEGRAREALRLIQGGENTIQLIAWEEHGYFFLNDSFVATLDLSGRSDFGDVVLGMGFYVDNEREGASTPYADFAVWSLAPQFGPRSGQLEHVDDNLVKSRSASVALANLMAEATFVNPYAAATGGWDIGFALRETDVNDQLWLIVDTTGEWSLINRVAGEDNYLVEGLVENLNVNEGGRNHLALIAWGEHGYFFLNDSYVAALDLSERLDAGDAEAVTAFFVGNEIAGNATGYENFTVWPLP